MAPGLEEELSCPVCRDIFRDPVFLSCSHSFCKSCLRRWWKKKDVRECPVCKRASGSKDPPCNLALKNTCQAFLLERDQKAAAVSADLCSLHAEKLKLFCLEHREPVCLVCRDSKAHINHRFRPIDEVAQDRREELQKILAPLHEKLKLFQQVQRNFNQTAEHIQVQVQHTEREMRKQFNKLQQFLREEEEARIAALRDEEEKKSWALTGKIEALGNEMLLLSEAVRATEEDLRAEDVSLLQRYAAAAERVQRCHLLDRPELGPGALIDEAKHLGNLSFNIWNKMKDVVSYTPVTLDPNSAEAGLILSEDLTSVRRGERQKLPENPERFDCHGIVLASEGFSSGSHGWAVDVGDSKAWFVGVAAEAFRRKGGTDLKSGLWAVSFSKGRYIILSPQEPCTFQPDRMLRLISIHLDSGTGTLSFCDAETQTCIHTFTHTCTERLFPIFYTGSEIPLKILPEVFDDGALGSPRERSGALGSARERWVCCSGLTVNADVGVTAELQTPSRFAPFPCDR
ncbi:E3 ubiquitin-protein ligase TRIM35-like [Xenentodon cancila]